VDRIEATREGSLSFQRLTINRIEYFATEPGARETMPSLLESLPVKSIGAAKTCHGSTQMKPAPGLDHSGGGIMVPLLRSAVLQIIQRASMA
jgi:hypothetical protein